MNFLSWSCRENVVQKQNTELLTWHENLAVRYCSWHVLSKERLAILSVIPSALWKVLNFNFFYICFVWSQIAGFNGLSDAFKRLDFRSAVHDVRRFNYICKLLDLLITQKLTMLSGCAQKVLFNMLEEVAYQGLFTLYCRYFTLLLYCICLHTILLMHSVLHTVLQVLPFFTALLKHILCHTFKSYLKPVGQTAI